MSKSPVEQDSCTIEIKELGHTDSAYESSMSFAVLGGGFAGVDSAIQIKKRFPKAHVVIFEKAPDFGGTWQWNSYPGCACDIPSHFYSLSYEPNPNWPLHYSKQPDIKEYIQGVARKYSLYELAR